MRIQLLIAVAALTISGCMSCQQTDYYKLIRLEGQKDIDIGHQRPDLAVISINDLLKIDIQTGGERRYSFVPPGQANHLMISLKLADKSVMRFTSDRILLKQAGVDDLVLEINKLSYLISCQSKATNRSCSSSELSPVIGGTLDAGKTKWASGDEFADVYSFSALLPFKGAQDTIDQGAWFGYRMNGWRRYYLSLMPKFQRLAPEFGVQLPDVEIDGVIYHIPVVIFRAVSEPVCRTISVD